MVLEQKEHHGSRLSCASKIASVCSPHFGPWPPGEPHQHPTNELASPIGWPPEMGITPAVVAKIFFRGGRGAPEAFHEARIRPLHARIVQLAGEGFLVQTRHPHYCPDKPCANWVSFALEYWA